MDAERKARDLDGRSGTPPGNGSEAHSGAVVAADQNLSTPSHRAEIREHGESNAREGVEEGLRGFARPRGEGEEGRSSSAGSGAEGGTAGERPGGRRHSGSTGPAEEGGGAGSGGSGGGYFDDDDDIDFDINDLEDVLV